LTPQYKDIILNYVSTYILKVNEDKDIHFSEDYQIDERVLISSVISILRGFSNMNLKLIIIISSSSSSSSLISTSSSSSSSSSYFSEREIEKIIHLIFYSGNDLNYYFLLNLWFFIIYFFSFILNLISSLI